MAVSTRSQAFSAGVVRASPRAQTVVVRAEKGNVQAIRMAAAVAVSAAALLSASPVEAKGVVMSQPNLKKTGLIYSKENAVVETRESRKLKGIAAVAAPPPVDFAFTVGTGVDVRLLALPAAVGGILGAGFLVSKLDNSFDKWFETAMVKSNIADGLGYEVVLKEGPLSGKVAPKKASFGTKTVSSKKGAPPPEPEKKFFFF